MKGRKRTNTEQKWIKGENPGIRKKKKIPGSAHVGFFCGQSGTGTSFSPSTSVCPCQFHSTGAPLQGKTKKKN
jgi:hypothetical protein